MEDKDKKTSLNQFVVTRLAFLFLFIALAINTLVKQQYTLAIISLIGILFSLWDVWRYSKVKVLQGEVTDVTDDKLQNQRFSILILCIIGALIAMYYEVKLLASLTLILGLGQIWFKPDITANERMLHGFSASILAIAGYYWYLPLAYVALGLSVIFLLDYYRRRKRESTPAKSAENVSEKKYAKRKKKKTSKRKRK